MLVLTDRHGTPTGNASRKECHGNPSLIHATVHLHVFTPEGKLYLQKRSATKDLYPGFWDTAVGGHVDAGEGPRQALLREANEELGLDATTARFMHRYLHTNSHESEFVHTYCMRHSGEIHTDPGEIDEVRAYRRADIRRLLGTGFVTPNFEEEFARISEHSFFTPP